MAKTIIVGGYGPGISSALAEKFGAEGFSVALVARHEERLSAAVKELAAKGVKAAAFPANLGDTASAASLVSRVRASLGPITVLQWNAYGGGAGDLLTADPAEVRGVFDIAVSGLLACVQASLPDLRNEKQAAILVTNGGLGLVDPSADAMAVQWGAMGLALANAAKHKLVALLAEKLKGTGIYVGEVMVLGAVKGTAFDTGKATIEASAVADAFWKLYRSRSEILANVS
ncbi:MAG: SDR family NAD(P)-dependent oxidoreductase [Myxococcota bacterium]|nr:SDR family NAD(P)-dependent oxidoreductase [Myxococcota bacterium]